MKANIKWLDDPEVFRVNQLPAHSDHPFYKDYREWQNHSSSFKQSLNGAGPLIFTNAALTHLPLTPSPFLVKLN